MLMDLLSKAATVAMLIFVVFSILAMGTGLTLARITEPLRNVRLVLLAVLVDGGELVTQAVEIIDDFAVALHDELSSRARRRRKVKAKRKSAS